MRDFDLIKLAQERFKLASDATAGIREAALDDLRFVAGEQWPDDIRNQRAADKRPCLTINKLPQFTHQVLNEERQNRPSIQISPVDDGGDPETAKVLQGLIRHIEVQSGADFAYDTGFEGAVNAGFGAFRVLTEYVDESSFDQQISIKRIRNPWCVYFDPSAQEPDYSDANWCLVIEDMSPEAYRAAFPDSELAKGPWEALGNKAPGWVTSKHARIAEYWWIEQAPATLCLIRTERGDVVLPKGEVPEGSLILKERSSTVRQVKWAKINGVEVLDRRDDYPGRYIPIVPVLGDELDVDGDVRLISLIRHAKDPQRMYNYWASAETEAIALAPRAPFIAAEGQLEGYERMWQEANTRNFPYLVYKPKTLGGSLAPAPQRQAAEPAIQAISHARLMSADDMKSTTGIYDASLGARSNETSGRGILARQRESDVATFHFSDNLARAIRHCGRILLDLIPRIYDTPRVLRIIGADNTPSTVKVNQPTVVDGVERIFDLTAGRYDVTVQVGPSFNTKRQEAVASMSELARAYPPLMQLAGDLIVKNMDWNGADEIAERLEAALPPELKPQKDGDQKPAIPPEVQQTMQAMGQQHEMLTAKVHELMDTLEGKELELRAEQSMKQAELDSRERIAALQEETKRLIAIGQLSQQEGLQLLRNELEAIKLDMQERMALTAQSAQAAQAEQMDQEQPEAAE
jgi:hypothetical protein